MPSMLADAVVVLYGVWTVACNLTVVAGGDAGDLAWVAGGLLLATLALAIGALRVPAVRTAFMADLEGCCPAAVAPLDQRTRVAVLLSLGVIVLAWLAGAGAPLVWGAIATLALAVAFVAHRMDVQVDLASNTAPIRGRELLGLHIIAIACALFTLIAFRPRTDDAFYLNMALSVVEYPKGALLAFERLHGPPTDTLPPQLMYPPYRVHSFELLGGFISYLSGIEVVKVVHFGLATFFAWFVPFALARALRLVAGRYWLLAVAVAVSVYFIEGTADRGYANQALVRMFNGKAVLLSVGVPLVCAHGLRFGLRPGAWRFALLSLAQISFMGMSSTGIWLAPVLATLSVAAATPFRPARWRSLALAPLSAGHVLAMGLWVRSQMSTRPVELLTGSSVAEAANNVLNMDFGLLLWVLPTVLGNASTAASILVAVGLAIALAPSAIAFRLLAAIVVTLAVVLTNPWAASAIASSITGPQTYQRIFWLLPFPIALGLAAVGATELLRARLKRAVPALLIVVALLAGFFAVATDRLVLSEANHAKALWPPSLKVWPIDRNIAQAACRWGSRDSTILAPLGVARQIVTLHGCGHPLQAGMRWMSAPLSEERNRNLMLAEIGKEHVLTTDRTDWFTGALKSYGIDVIVMAKSAVGNRRVKAVLRRDGWERVEVLERALIWVRTRPETRERFQEVATSVCERVPEGGLIVSPFALARELPESCGIALMRPVQGRAFTEEDAEVGKLEGFLALNQRPDRKELDWLRERLRTLRPKIIVLDHRARQHRGTRRMLRRLGYERVESVAKHHVYRPRPPMPRAPASANQPAEQPGPAVR